MFSLNGKLIVQIQAILSVLQPHLYFWFIINSNDAVTNVPINSDTVFWMVNLRQ